MIGRQIAITERAHLHLLWGDSTIFLKPLPDYLMTYNMWHDLLCREQGLFEDANGFLLSYMWLICHKSDLKIASVARYYLRKLMRTSTMLIHDTSMASCDLDDWTSFIAFVGRLGPLRHSFADITIATTSIQPSWSVTLHGP
jgi:hypothetical protein